MDDKLRCQSCGMPLDGAVENFGTEADGTPSRDYCKFCYQEGSFTAPELTLSQMVQSSVDFMTANLGFSREEAAQLSNNVIRRLKRWQ
jgi:hypothetical protein